MVKFLAMAYKFLHDVSPCLPFSVHSTSATLNFPIFFDHAFPGLNICFCSVWSALPSCLCTACSLTSFRGPLRVYLFREIFSDLTIENSDRPSSLSLWLYFLWHLYYLKFNDLLVYLFIICLPH